MAVFRIPVTLSWPGAGSPGVNVFHLRTTESSGSASNLLIIDEALNDLHTFLFACYQEVGCNGLAYSAGQGIVDVATQEEISRTGWSETNSVADGAAPPVLAVVVGWRTTLAARRGRGRTFLGPLRSGVIQSDGTIGTTALNALQSAASTFVTNSQGIAGGAFAVYGQENLGDPSGHVARDITGYRIKDKFAVLRSRRD